MENPFDSNGCGKQDSELSNPYDRRTNVTRRVAQCIHSRVLAETEAIALSSLIVGVAIMSMSDVRPELAFGLPATGSVYGVVMNRFISRHS